MSIKAIIPTPVEIGREALIVLGGAILAALAFKYLMPQLQSWMPSIQVKDSNGNIVI